MNDSSSRRGKSYVALTITVNAAPLFGVTDESPRMQAWFNCGWEF